LGGTIRNIVIPGSVAGLAIGQPFVTSDLGNATQTNVEAYYRFNLNDSVIFSPAFLVVTNPNNRAIGTIFEWVVRMNFSF
jgi:carbohydrate-selective porin OprB